MFTGAPARIAQEAALAEALMEGDVPGCPPISPVMVVGSSAGAINAVAVNAVLRHHPQAARGHDEDPAAVSAHLQRRKGDLSWHDYRQLLAGLDNEMIYTGGARALVHVAAHVGNGFLLDSSPLRALLAETLQEMGFDRLASLEIPTYLSVADASTGQSQFLSNASTDQSVRQLPLVDVLMASTAIPGLFPPQQLPGMEGEFIDGSCGRTCLPASVPRRHRISDLYVISPDHSKHREPTRLTRRSQPPAPGDGHGGPGQWLARAGAAYENLSAVLFAYECEYLATMARRTFAFSPTLQSAYALMDFRDLGAQYAAALRWARELGERWEQVEHRMQDAANSLVIAEAADGTSTVVAAGFGTRREVALEVEERRVWGVRFPEVRKRPLGRRVHERGLATTATNVRFDRAAKGFETALDAIVDTAPLQVRIRRLGAELQRTARRINTPEQRVIAGLEREITGIELRLQERDREEQFRLKRFKRRKGRGVDGSR